MVLQAALVLKESRNIINPDLGPVKHTHKRQQMWPVRLEGMGAERGHQG